MNHVSETPAPFKVTHSRTAHTHFFNNMREENLLLKCKKIKKYICWQVSHGMNRPQSCFPLQSYLCTAVLHYNTPQTSYTVICCCHVIADQHARFLGQCSQSSDKKSCCCERCFNLCCPRASTHTLTLCLLVYRLIIYPASPGLC